MMHKVWNNIEEVPLCFQDHLSNLKVTWSEKIMISFWFECFRLVIPIKNYRMAMKWHTQRLGARKRSPFVFEVICQVLMSCHTGTNLTIWVQFDCLRLLYKLVKLKKQHLTWYANISRRVYLCFVLPSYTHARFQWDLLYHQKQTLIDSCKTREWFMVLKLNSYLPRSHRLEQYKRSLHFIYIPQALSSKYVTLLAKVLCLHSE